MKKLFATLIALLLATNVFAVYDFSAVCSTGQTLYYKIRSNNQVSLSPPGMGNWDGYSQPVGDLIIPDTVIHDGITFTVTDIWDYAFYHCTGLTSVKIPNTLLMIHKNSFVHCTSLSNLIIGSSVKTIEEGAFNNCTGLQSLYCHAQNPPQYMQVPGLSIELFRNTPTDIPFYVSCFTIDQYQSDPDWSRFTNMIPEFNGTCSLYVNVNNPDYGTSEIVSIPEDCDHPTATVRAIANPGHRFSYWKKGISIVSSDSEYTFVLDKDYSLTAYFDSFPFVDSIGFPDQVIGRVFDNSGEVIDEIVSNFSYGTDGVLNSYTLPSGIYTNFTFHQFPTMPSYISTTFAGHPNSYESNSYTYENNQIKHYESRSWSEYWDDGYYYLDYEYDGHRLSQMRISYSEDNWQGVHLYTYENGNTTRIDSYYVGSDLHLSSITTNQYNQRHQLLTSQTDTYNNSGSITSQTLVSHTYTYYNKTDSIVTQIYNDSVWVKSKMEHYVYDINNRVVEYQTGLWSNEDYDWNITNKVLYDYNDETQTNLVSFWKKNGDEWERDTFSSQSLFNDSRLSEWERALKKAYLLQNIGQFIFNMHYDLLENTFPFFSEWYYELEWGNSDITYQHLEYTADTTINNKRPKIIIRSNTQYDRDWQTEVTHEYILEENNKVYWWNKDLHECTTLYDYNAEAGDEWEVKVGLESFTVHVDSTGIFEYEGTSSKVIHISDAGNYFSGDIVVGYGHMTSFFPEKLMSRNGDFTVNGLRCYWVGDILVYHNGDEDCDAIYGEIHGVEEDGLSTGSEAFTVYPNPANGTLTVSVRLPQWDSPTMGQTEYQISNLMGQTLLQGRISAENQQIDISTLPAGMYFISVGKQTVKFVVK